MAAHPHHPDDLVRLDDGELVRLAQRCWQGEAAELETAKRCVAVVLLRHRSLIRGVIAAKVPATAIDDVESDVFARFSAKIYAGHEITNPAGLLVRMATFLRADYLERRRDGEAPLGDWDAAADDPAFDAITDEDAVDELLAPLNQRQRDAVWGRIVEGRSSAEVAAILDTTPGNIDVMVHRALAKMRQALP
jgi:RNA polymerase sigma factor (sigma-70 family)